MSILILNSLQYINLEGNKLGDYAIVSLCEILSDNDTIRKLNLNRNFLTNRSANLIGKMLLNNDTLEELYLSWNQIKGQGGIDIIAGITQSSRIRVLDFSWNALGAQNISCAQSLANFIDKNKKLVHLDLSNNYFAKDSACIIAKALENNHTLYGLHFQGNFGYIDAKGFLIVEENYEA